MQDVISICKICAEFLLARCCCCMRTWCPRFFEGCVYQSCQIGLIHNRSKWWISRLVHVWWHASGHWIWSWKRRRCFNRFQYLEMQPNFCLKILGFSYWSSPRDVCPAYVPWYRICALPASANPRSDRPAIAASRRCATQCWSHHNQHQIVETLLST